jgi:hypothetical protein
LRHEYQARHNSASFIEAAFFEGFEMPALTTTKGGRTKQMKLGGRTANLLAALHRVIPSTPKSVTFTLSELGEGTDRRFVANLLVLDGVHRWAASAHDGLYIGWPSGLCTPECGVHPGERRLSVVDLECSSPEIDDLGEISSNDSEPASAGDRRLSVLGTAHREVQETARLWEERNRLQGLQTISDERIKELTERLEVSTAEGSRLKQRVAGLDTYSACAYV